MKNLSKTFALAAAAVAVAAPSLTVAGPAQAASRDGSCNSGEFCYFYNSGEKGSVSDFTGSIDDYGATQPSCYEFKGAGKGKDLCVKNHAASVWNRSSKTVRVYFNSNYGGTYQDFKAGAKGNLKTSLKNNNASHSFGVPKKSSNLSYALYDRSGGHITCGFDGYTTTPGRHEGIDIARGIGSSVHALVSGKVINVARGAKGSNGLSTIAIYSSSLNKTIVYLHSAPLGSLSSGQTIKRGQKIATESWHGVSSSGAAHTHVEMRPGRQTLAAKSVRDRHLDNPNPTRFWQSQHYNVR